MRNGKTYTARISSGFIPGTPVDKIMPVLQIGDSVSSLYRGVAISDGSNPMYPEGEAYITEQICLDGDFEITEL